MTLHDVIEIYLNRKVDFFNDIKIFLNDNNEPYIKDWNVSEQQPTQEYIESLLPKCKKNLNAVCKCNTEYAGCKEIEKKILELKEKCNETILAGFYSKAYGGIEEHWYTYSYEDQININSKVLDAMTGINNLEYKYSGLDEYINYTTEEIIQLGKDASAHKIFNINKYNAKKIFIKNNNLTKEQLKTITWDSI